MGINLENLIDLNNTEGIKHGVINGLGISLLPYHTVILELSQGLLSFKRLNDMPLMRNFYLVHLNEKTLTTSDNLFIELAFENAAAGIFQENESDLSVVTDKSVSNGAGHHRPVDQNT